ncbi:hypothetical protein C8R43DRAFT_1007639 [Mycena crocata]|nr:hypothetical protein C8R43DRAFT_1007639 [Mycena crocata]
MLPTELERIIFHIVAFENPEVMPVLLRVAHRVKVVWIEPLLYKVIYDNKIYGRRWRMAAELAALMDSRPAFFRTHVRHICLRGMASLGDTEKILRICSATTHLRLFCLEDDQCEPAPALINAVADLPLHRLVLAHALIRPSPDDLSDFSHPLFAKITHPELGSRHDDDSMDWSTLAHMVALTHLSFHNNWVSSYACQLALNRYPVLRVLAIVCLNEATLVRIAPEFAAVAVDIRFAMVVVRNDLEDWERGARGGEDYWTAAEALVSKRSTGDVAKGR